MSEQSLNRSWGRLNTARHTPETTTLPGAGHNSWARRKRRINSGSVKKTAWTNNPNETGQNAIAFKKRRTNALDQAADARHCILGTATSVDQPGLTLTTSVVGSVCSEPGVSSNLKSTAREETVSDWLFDHWESDSGFASEVSPTASGRSSPSPTLNVNVANVVAMDCEMVGTGPDGRCSELARCSVLNYDGSILYDKYVLPCQPVTDYRTPWSGIRKHHLQSALPFNEARSEILSILRGKVVVGHALHNDFDALDLAPPMASVRDTSSSRLLGQLSGFPAKRSASLKRLANKLLNRKIQTGRQGHCSVEDALAALDLYKLVEEEWEQELQSARRAWSHTHTLAEPSSTDHYMEDQYWPEHVTDMSQ